MTHSSIHRAMRLFGRQDALATSSQLDLLGVTRSQIRSRIRSGEWERVDRGLIGLPGVEMTWRRRCRRALLTADPRAALAAASVGRIHALDGYERDERVFLAFPGAVRPRAMGDDVVGFRTMELTQRDCHVVDGLRCVSRPIALIQITAIDGVDAAARALDSMLRDGNSPAWIRQTASRWRRSGVVGPAEVLRLLDERVGGRLPRSWFQRLAKRALAGRGFTSVDEFPVHDVDGRKLAELDLALPGLKIGVECQSWKWHASPGARARDAARKRSLRRMGWEIVEVWWSDLDDLDGAAEDLRRLIDQRMPTFSTGLWSPDDHNPVEKW